MKALLFGLSLALLAHTASAETFTYQLYYDEEKTEALDIQIELTLSGKFEKGSKVEGLKIWGRNKKPVLLFDIKTEEITAKWNSKGVLHLDSKVFVESLVKKEYIAIHSDTNINAGEVYSFENLVINEEGTLDQDGEGFYLGNQTVEEMALNGFLKIVK